MASNLTDSRETNEDAISKAGTQNWKRKIHHPAEREHQLLKAALTVTSQYKLELEIAKWWG